MDSVGLDWKYLLGAFCMYYILLMHCNYWVNKSQNTKLDLLFFSMKIAYNKACRTEMSALAYPALTRYHLLGREKELQSISELNFCLNVCPGCSFPWESCLLSVHLHYIQCLCCKESHLLHEAAITVIKLHISALSREPVYFSMQLEPPNQQFFSQC